MLRINDFDLIISKVKNVTIITYSVIIRNVIVENDSSVSRMPSPRIVIFIKLLISIKELTSRQAVIFMKITSFARETPSHKTVISVKSSTFAKTSIAKETSFIETFHIATINEYRSFHIDIKDVIAFASLKMKKIYNARHQFIFFKIENLINLRLHKNYKVSIITSKKIESQLIRLFKILEKIERLIYRLKLSINMKIYNVIFIVYLKPAIDFIENLYRRRRLLAFIVVIDEEKKYEIEKLLKKRIIKRERE